MAGLQYDLVWEDPGANCRKVAEQWAMRPPSAGSLVVLPEMFSTGFTMNPGGGAQPEGGAVEVFLAGLAKAHGVTLVAGLAVARPTGVWTNEALVFDAEGVVRARYRKQRLFTPGGEAERYVPGTAPVVFRWGEATVAPFVCYDLRFPELFRAVARRDRPELLVVIASWPDKRVAHWVRLLQARAIENQAYVIGVNRVGNDPIHAYSGRSLIVNPWGDLVADAGEAAGWVTTTLDLEALRDYRAKLPFLDDLRPVAT